MCAHAAFRGVGQPPTPDRGHPNSLSVLWCCRHFMCSYWHFRLGLRVGSVGCMVVAGKGTRATTMRVGVGACSNVGLRGVGCVCFVSGVAQGGGGGSLFASADGRGVGALAVWFHLLASIGWASVAPLAMSRLASVCLSSGRARVSCRHPSSKAVTNDGRRKRLLSLPRDPLAW